ncbi:MAG: GNAT family N-acetyltransferase [Proteobacteria bacterium]|nr:GNAT family N-acetyltransferase [Pseudomonadota bacterium]
MLEDAENIARMHVESWREAYAGIVPQSHLDAMNVEERAQQRRDGNLSSAEKVSKAPTFLAVDGADVAGFAICGPSRNDEIPFKGELYAIYLLRKYQGAGVGKELLRLCRENLRQRGFLTMYAWVLRKNPTLEWYLKNGAVLLPYTKTLVFSGVELEEVAVGWNDLV